MMHSINDDEAHLTYSFIPHLIISDLCVTQQNVIVCIFLMRHALRWSERDRHMTGMTG